MNPSEFSDQLQGVFPVIPTFFKHNQELDFDAQKKVIHFALNAGCSALVYPAVASEYNFLSLSEREQLLPLVSREVNGRVPIIGGASASEIEEVIAAGNICLESGIKTLMVLAPKELGLDTARQRDFFDRCAAAWSDAEIILQNAPQPIGAGLPVESIVEIVSNNPKITYVKEETLPSGPTITALNRSTIAHLKGVIGGGGSRYMIDELNRGALGVMPAVELVDLHVAIFKAHQNGEYHRARELYRLSLPLLVSQTIYRMRLTKYVLHRRGVENDLVVRAALPEFDEFNRRDLDEMLSDLLGDFS